jgi:iron complex outermembrane recepter protein
MNRSKLKIILSLFLALLFIANTRAQNLIVKGTITTRDGKPAAQVNVQLAETKQTIATNATGIYQFSNLQRGKYNLVVSYVGLATQVKHITITDESKEQVINFVLLENQTKRNYSFRHFNQIR